MKRTGEEIVWRGMTRAELDVAYNNSAAVPDSTAYLADWTARSAALRSAHPDLLDRRYGPRERNRIDLFRCGAVDAPLLVFLHGGYWQRNSKDMFSCMAAGPLAHGLDVALPGYTLAPDASLTEIVEEVRAAIRLLRREAPVLGVAKARMIVSGWSAGGHLAAMAMSLPEVDAGLAISGVYDVEPCRLNYLNEKLKLTREEADAMSVIRHLPARAGPLMVAYGGRELPELQRQSQEFGGAWTSGGLDGQTVPLPGHHHFSILEELAMPAGELACAAATLAEAGAIPRTAEGRKLSPS